MQNVYSYIRWSTPEQGMGDSERRQLKMAEDWCSRNGLALSERNFADQGTSAYKGRNRSSGQLGDLLKLVRSGDTILIEDPDRFSREDPISAMSNLRETVTG